MRPIGLYPVFIAYDKFASHVLASPIFGSVRIKVNKPTVYALAIAPKVKRVCRNTYYKPLSWIIETNSRIGNSG